MTRLTTPSPARRTLAAVATAILVFAAVASALLLRPEAYDARIGLLAVPRTAPAAAERADFGVVVANSLPALVEVAHSTSAASSAAARVPGAPDDPGTITKGVTVELVPASGLARLTVRAEDPEVAAGLASALADELVQANLLSPTAALRVLDPMPTVQQASPDVPMAVGLALAAAVVAAAATLGAATLWWPHPTRRLRRLLGEAGVGHSVALIRDDGAAEGLAELRLVRETAGRPLRLVASEPPLNVAVARLSDALDLDPARFTDARRVAVGLVTHPAATLETLRAAIGALPDPHEVVAVILSDDRAGTHSPGSDHRPSAERAAGGRHATRTADAGLPQDDTVAEDAVAGDTVAGKTVAGRTVAGDTTPASAR